MRTDPGRPTPTSLPWVTRLVGRDDEVALLEAELDRARSGELRCVVLLLDDMHLADASSWEALSYLARGLAGARVLTELPVMTKDDLIANFDEIVTDDRLRLDVVEAHLKRLDHRDAYLFDRYHAVASVGSTGRRGVFVYDWDAWTLVFFGSPAA